jgi:hypothetical protein
MKLTTTPVRVATGVNEGCLVFGDDRLLASEAGLAAQSPSSTSLTFVAKSAYEYGLAIS